MSDFSNKRKERCPCCGIWFLAEEGKDCSCWQCNNCGEWFSDFDMLGNKELMLCLYCENLRYPKEVENVPNTHESR